MPKRLEREAATQKKTKFGGKLEREVIERRRS
jgi:hypothetical protein